MIAPVTPTVGGIPLVDFAGFADGAAARRDSVAAALRGALETYGFCYLSSHGVPAPVLDALFAQSRAFFGLPLADKQRVRPADPRSTRGYGGVATQALDETRPADLKEVFQAGPEREEIRPNAWPERMPAFQTAVRAFHDAACATCMQLMRAIASSLGLAEDYFQPYYTHTDSTARLLHYRNSSVSVRRM